MVTCPVPSLGSDFKVREGGRDLLIVIGEGIIIGVVVVLEGIPEGKGVFTLSCEWFGGGPNEAWCSGLGHGWLCGYWG